MAKAKAIETFVSEGYNCVTVNGVTQKFCDFTFVVRRHAIDIETEATKYILDCKTIVDEELFFVILDRNDLNSPQSFWKVSYLTVGMIHCQ